MKTTADKELQRRLVIKAQLRTLGIGWPPALSNDLGALRKWRRIVA